MSARIVSFLVLVMLSSPGVLACTACFGQSDSRMAQGMNMGILSLLLMITCVLGGVAAFFIYLARRSSEHAGQQQTLKPISQNSTNA